MLDNEIWKNIGNKKFCSFKKKTDTEYLCKNKNNLTGLCNSFSCPLANTKFATVRALDEELYLYIKEPERINTPIEQFEKIKLSKNYEEAIQQIDSELKHWDKLVIHKCKQKLTKLFEYLQRLEYFKEHGRVEYMKRIKKKITRAEKLAALANLESLDFEKQIGEELLMRLESGVYGNELKDKYQKANEKFVNETKNKKKKKKYVPHFEDIEEDENLDRTEDKEDKDENSDSVEFVKKKKKEKKKIVW